MIRDPWKNTLTGAMHLTPLTSSAVYKVFEVHQSHVGPSTSEYLISLLLIM